MTIRSSRRSIFLLFRFVLTTFVMILLCIVVLGLIFIGPRGVGEAILFSAIGLLYAFKVATPVMIPVDDENVEIVYRLDNMNMFDDPEVEILLLDKSMPPKTLASTRVHCGEDCNANVWRRPSEPRSYYLEIRGQEYRLDLPAQTIARVENSKDVCASDAQAPQWSRAMFWEGMRANAERRPVEDLLLGQVRNGKFIRAESLPPIPAMQRRNCEAETKAWYASIEVNPSPHLPKIAVRVRWAPGEDFDYELNFAGGRVIARHRDKFPTDDPSARQFRFSFYRAGGRIVLISHIQGSIVIRQEMTQGRFELPERHSSIRARCRDASRKLKDGSTNGEAISRFFDGWTWLGAFEAKLTPGPDGGLIGDLKFAAPPKDAEIFESPERVCISPVEHGPSSSPHAADGGTP